MNVLNYPKTCPICSQNIKSYRLWMVHVKAHPNELVLTQEFAKPNANYPWETIKIYEPVATNA